METITVTKTLTVKPPGLSNKIKAARKSDPRSITELAFLAGMTAANWYRIEKGEGSIPTETLRKIEEVLGVDFGVTI